MYSTARKYTSLVYFFFFFFGEKMVNDERREFNLSKLFGMPVGLKFVPHFH